MMLDTHIKSLAMPQVWKSPTQVHLLTVRSAKTTAGGDPVNIGHLIATTANASVQH